MITFKIKTLRKYDKKNKDKIIIYLILASIKTDIEQDQFEKAERFIQKIISYFNYNFDCNISK